MSNNWDKIFEGYECPDNKMLQDYLDGKLPAKEKHQIERHLVDCEMCSDELEGLMLMNDRNKLDTIVEDIKTKSLRKHGRIIPFVRKYRVIAAAAVLVILAALVIVLQLSTESGQTKIVADKTEVKPEIPVTEIDTAEDNIMAGSEENTRIIPPDEFVGKETQQTTIAMEIIQDKAEADHFEDVVAGVLSDKDALDDVPEAGEIYNIVIAEEADNYEFHENKMAAAGKSETSRSPVSSKSETAELNQVVITNKKAADVAVVESLSKKSAKRTATVSPIVKAMEKFDAGKFDAASGIFEEIIEKDSINFKALYYNALCYYELKNYDTAVHYLNKVLIKVENDYYQKAEIKKAEILILQNILPQAKSLLDKIIQDNGEYKPEAEKLLKYLTE